VNIEVSNMPANKPLWVGGFTLGGLALAALAIVLFSGKRLFATKGEAMVVFNGSVAGLNVGSIVTFRGVPIGAVKALRIEADPQMNTGLIPVTLELDYDRISWSKGQRAPDDNSGLSRAVAAGLRAELVSQSLVTGQLEIDLDFHLGTPAVPKHTLDGLVEIPTLPSDIQNLKDKLLKLDLAGVVNETRHTLATLEKLSTDVDRRIGPVAESLQNTLQTTDLAVKAVQMEVAQTLAQINQLVLESRSQLTANGNDLDKLIRVTERTAAEAEKLVATLNDMTAPRSPLRSDLQASLRDLAASADSLRQLTRNLERNPVGTLIHKASP
jgi:paraquat-inducible protein B